MGNQSTCPTPPAAAGISTGFGDIHNRLEFSPKPIAFLVTQDRPTVRTSSPRTHTDTHICTCTFVRTLEHLTHTHAVTHIRRHMHRLIKTAYIRDTLTGHGCGTTAGCAAHQCGAAGG